MQTKSAPLCKARTSAPQPRFARSRFADRAFCARPSFSFFLNKKGRARKARGATGRMLSRATFFDLRGFF